MSEMSLVSHPALAGLLQPGRYGVPRGTAGSRIGPETGLSLATLAARDGHEEALQAAVREAFGTELPDQPRVTDGRGVAFVWSGPRRWLVVREGDDLEPELRDRLGVHATVTDQSDGRTVLRVEGPRARDMLAKGLPVDLHPRCFGPGDVALTHFAHLGVQVWQLDDHPSFRLSVLSGYARAALALMLDAGAEYGVELAENA